jgi:hypothetical protein
MFRRLKRIYDLSKKDPEALKVLETLSPEQLKIVPEAGDGKAEFFGDGTDEEYQEFLKEENGTKAWYDRIKL